MDFHFLCGLLILLLCSLMPEGSTASGLKCNKCNPCKNTTDLGAPEDCDTAVPLNDTMKHACTSSYDATDKNIVRKCDQFPVDFPLPRIPDCQSVLAVEGFHVVCACSGKPLCNKGEDTINKVTMPKVIPKHGLIAGSGVGSSQLPSVVGQTLLGLLNLVL